MCKLRIKRSVGRLCLAIVVSLVAGKPRIVSAAPRTVAANSFNAKFGLQPGIKYAIVWADGRVSGPPDVHFKIFGFFPQYNPKVAYDPGDPTTSPLEPPTTRGGHAYYGNKSYNGLTAEQTWGFPTPALTNPKDTVGYGRAFNLPDVFSPSSGNAPPLLMNSATQIKPPDLEALAAGQAAAQNAALATATVTLAGAEIVPEVMTAASSPRPVVAEARAVAQTQPAQSSRHAARPAEAVSLKLISAIKAEDEIHTRANLPALRPPK